MFNVSPENLRDEIRAACELRDKHLAQKEQIETRARGRFYRVDRKPDMPILANHAYEYLSSMLPAVIYNSPRCKVHALNRHRTDALGLTTMGQRANEIQSALNQWSVNDEIDGVLSQAATDFFFNYCVILVQMTDAPGFQGVDLQPQKPRIMVIDQRHFAWDAQAKTLDPLRLNGPRWMAHSWKADREDLLNDPDFDPNQVALVAIDTDFDKWGSRERDQWIGNIPERDEIWCWDVWVPEHDVRRSEDYDGMVSPDEPGYNGSVFTIACHVTPEGQSKQWQYLRKPVPCFCPPWGPYVVGGYMEIGGAYPLGPIMATAEQAEEVNAHRIAAAQSAKDYKRFATYNLLNPGDGELVQRVKHGGVVGVQDAASVKEVETGGVSDGQYAYTQFAEDRLARTAGMSQSYSGDPKADTTATAESIAQSGLAARQAGLKAKFRRIVKRVFQTAAWYAHYGTAFRMSLGEEAERLELGSSEYRGGILPGMEEFNYFDLVLDIEPYSMEHTDQAMLQKRMTEAWDKLVQAVPLMVQAPFIRWGDVLKQYFQIVNIEDANEWLDEQLLQAAQGIQGLLAQTMAGQGGQMAPTAPMAIGGPEMGNQQGDAQAAMQSQAAEMGAMTQ